MGIYSYTYHPPVYKSSVYTFVTEKHYKLEIGGYFHWRIVNGVDQEYEKIINFCSATLDLTGELSVGPGDGVNKGIFIGHYVYWERIINPPPGTDPSGCWNKTDLGSCSYVLKDGQLITDPCIWDRTPLAIYAWDNNESEYQEMAEREDYSWSKPDNPPKQPATADDVESDPEDPVESDNLA